MRCDSFLLQVVSFLAISYPSVYALPAELNTLLERTTVPADTIDKYTMGWFLDNACNPRSKVPHCLFYTAYQSENAKKYAEGHNMLTIWDLWKKPLYDNSQDESNPLRDIFKDDNTRQTYFENMSSAMASMCDGDSSVMDPNPSKVKTDGIFGQTEWVQLQRTDNIGKVDKITAFDTNGKNAQTFWQRAEISSSGGGQGYIGASGCGTTKKVAGIFDGDSASDSEYWVKW